MRFVIFAIACIVLEVAFKGDRNLWYYFVLAFIFLFVNRKREIRGTSPSVLGLDHDKDLKSASQATDSKEGEPQSPSPPRNDNEVNEVARAVDESPPVNSTVQVAQASGSGTTQRELDAKSAAPHGRRFWFIASGVGISIILVLAYLAFTSTSLHQPSSAPSPTSGTFHASVDVWSREACKEQAFANLTIAAGDNVNLRKQQEVWFCAHQWDDAFIAKVARMLESNGLLPVQWYPGHGYDRGFYESIPEPAANFAKVFDGGRLLLPESASAEFESQRPYFPALPKPSTLKSVKAHVGLASNATISKPLPQVYPVNADQPAIHLVTNLGTQLSLEEAMLLIQSSLDGRLFDGMNKAQQMGVHLEGYGTWMNPDAFSVAVMLELMLHEATNERAARGLKPLPDLEVLYVSDDISGPSGVLSHRGGYFDPHASRVYARMAGYTPVHAGPSREAVSELVSSVLPAALEHEYFHYLFYRPEISGSGFILEGEATANGERLHQGIVAGASLTQDGGDRLRQLVNKIEASPASLSLGEWEEYETLEGQVLSRQPLTEVQCNSLSLVYRHHVVRQEPFDLSLLLPVKPADFNASDPVLRYAEAWAVYHVDMVEKKRWQKQLDRIFLNLASGQSIAPDDSALLSTISKETLHWVKTRAETKDASCEP
jgi:hypothetical protein